MILKYDLKIIVNDVQICGLCLGMSVRSINSW